nr:MAG TPA: hypothetical protein [Caudoviricetes sp.]
MGSEKLSAVSCWALDPLPLIGQWVLLFLMETHNEV